MRAIIDSNVFVAFFWKRDLNRKKTINIITDIKNKVIQPFVPAIFLPEVCGSIQRRINDANVTRQIKQEITGMVDEEILNEVELTKARIRSASETSIKFGLKGPDAIYVDLAIEKKAALITFDESLKKKIKGKIKLFKI